MRSRETVLLDDTLLCDFDERVKSCDTTLLDDTLPCGFSEGGRLWDVIYWNIVLNVDFVVESVVDFKMFVLWSGSGRVIIGLGQKLALSPCGAKVER